MNPPNHEGKTCQQCGKPITRQTGSWPEHARVYCWPCGVSVATDTLPKRRTTSKTSLPGRVS
jgi:uncharacterized Zn finger protein (UPF0148 family)